MFKVAALGIAPVGFDAEPMKNDADINKFSQRYIQVLMGPGPTADVKPCSQYEITSTAEYKHCQNAWQHYQVILLKHEVFTAEEHKIS